MNRICDERNCTGCGACAAICPMNAITMKMSKGFKYPWIDHSKCIDCNRCTGVCPTNNAVSKNEPIGKVAIAAFNKDKKVRDISSSGGVFYSLARNIIQNGGTVYGAAWDNLSVKHIRITKMDEIGLIQGSKYLQSEIGGAYTQVKRDLKNGKKVMFSGTPCQVAGLRQYIGEECTEKLVLCEVLCHGAASPDVFTKHLKAIEKKEQTGVVAVNFRYKNEERCQNLEYKFQNGTHILFRNPLEDLFYKGFLNGTLLRDACFSCQYIGTDRCADITLGDFWGLKYEGEDFQRPDNISYPSLVLVNTLKGRNLWETIIDDFFIAKRPLEEAVWGNLCFRRSLPLNKYHEAFFKTYEEKGYEVARDRFLAHQFSIKDVIKQLLGKRITNKIIRILKR